MLADPEVDAVALLLPHQIHHETAMAALEAGKHVCVEKPITVTAREAEDLIEAAAERDLTLAVAENTRYVRAYVEADRMIRDGAVGDVRLVRGFIADQILDEWADTSDETQAWKREPGGCGAIMDCAPHMFDLLTWYFGDVAELQAFARGWVPEVDLDNHSVVAGKMAAGPFFSIELASLTEYPRGERVEIFGSDGTLIIDQVLDPPMVLYKGDRDLGGRRSPRCPTTSPAGRRSRSAPPRPTSSTRSGAAVSPASPARSRSTWSRWSSARMSPPPMVGWSSMGGRAKDPTARAVDRRSARPRGRARLGDRRLHGRDHQPPHLGAGGAVGLAVGRVRARRCGGDRRRPARAERGRPPVGGGRGRLARRGPGSAVPGDGGRGMSIAAPIAATGVALPVAVGLAGGDDPTALQTIGIVAAFAGVLLCSQEPQAKREQRGPLAAGVGLALLAAVTGA